MRTNQPRSWPIIQDRLDSFVNEVNQRLDRYRRLTDPAERELVGTSLRVSYEVGNWLFEGHRPV